MTHMSVDWSLWDTEFRLGFRSAPPRFGLGARNKIRFIRTKIKADKYLAPAESCSIETLVGHPRLLGEYRLYFSAGSIANESKPSLPVCFYHGSRIDLIVQASSEDPYFDHKARLMHHDREVYQRSKVKNALFSSWLMLLFTVNPSSN